MDAAKKTTVELWGLDSVFRSHAKLFIKDILLMNEIEDYQGVFQFLDHTVVRVDIQGVVVKVDERENVFTYALDDGTGVISCTQWKKKENEEQHQSIIESLQQELSNMWREVNKEKTISYHGYSLGDFVHVRGKLKKYKEKLEVMVSQCVCISDPNKETQRMIFLPLLYKRCYNKPITLPRAFELSDPDGGIVSELHTSYMEVALVNIIQQLKLFTTEHLLNADQVISLFRNKEQGRAVLNKVLSDLEAGGQIFRSNPPQQQPTFIVTSQCSELKDNIRNIIMQWVDIHDNTDGCSEYYIYEQLRKNLCFQSISRGAFSLCLENMEKDSDIIHTGQKKYVVFD